ncbi:Odorant receptor 354 [Nylanderia fulva]|uniref:Odorant receptor 354 n=1 Tax=Nylanderia fulva TaxID=613905 RepID=A0A6G1LPN7_9HYME|nr:Odorant receptor 354 [Nylanderia fulva]
MSNMLIIQYFQYLYVFNHFKMSELSKLVDSLPSTLEYTLTVFKMTILFLRRRHLYVMNVKTNLSHFFYNAMLGFNAIAGILYYIGDYALQSTSVTDDYNETLRQLPLRMQLPLKFEQSPIFELIVVYVFLQFLVHVFTVTVVNGLILTLVFHVSGQIESYCQEFNNISKNISLNGSFAPILGLSIYRHNKSINNRAGVMVLIKKPIFAYVAVTIEAFLLALAGEYLSFKSTSIADAAYESLWYNMPLKQSKVITFIIMRSHRRLAITAGKIVDMSFETFSSIIKTSASYISVLHAMY